MSHIKSPAPLGRDSRPKFISRGFSCFTLFRFSEPHSQASLVLCAATYPAVLLYPGLYEFLGHKGVRAAVYRSLKQTRFSQSSLTKSKGREMSGVETRKECISVRPTPRRQRTSVSETVSKVPKMLPGLCEENVGQR